MTSDERAAYVRVLTWALIQMEASEVTGTVAPLHPIVQFIDHLLEEEERDVIDDYKVIRTRPEAITDAQITPEELDMAKAEMFLILQRLGRWEGNP